MMSFRIDGGLEIAGGDIAGRWLRLSYLTGRHGQEGALRIPARDLKTRRLGQGWILLITRLLADHREKTRRVGAEEVTRRAGVAKKRPLHFCGDQSWSARAPKSCKVFAKIAAQTSLNGRDFLSLGRFHSGGRRAIARQRWRPFRGLSTSR